MIGTNLSFVLLLRDEYDGRVILNGGQSFLVDGRPARPLQKREGYYVFTGLAGESFEVTVGGGRYQPVTARVAPEPGRPVTVLRLQRRPGMFSDCGWLCGGGLPPETPLFARLESSGLSFQSAKLQDEVPLLGVQGYCYRSLSGLRLAVGEGRTLETFLIAGRGTDGVYALERPLSHKHGPGEPIVRVSYGVTDANGEYRLPVEPGAEITQVEYSQGEGRPWGCSSVTARS